MSVDLKPISDSELSYVLIPIKGQDFHRDACDSCNLSYPLLILFSFHLGSVCPHLTTCRTWALLSC